MTQSTDTTPFDLAIVGGGAGGVLAAIHALDQAGGCAGSNERRFVIVEPEAVLARGVAYATSHAEHLLNVPARRMSAFDEQPDDFVQFLLAQADAKARAIVDISYAERRQYGAYLRQRLAEAAAASSASLTHLRDRVTGVDEAGGIASLALASGARVQARGVLLALGNSARPLPARGASSLAPGRLLEAWDFEAIAQVPAEAEVCIAGSGLSMVDTVLSLAANGHRGRIHVVSRHALLPLPHAPHAASDFDAATLVPMDLRQRVRSLRQAAARAAGQGLPWQAVMEAARPGVQALWQTLGVDDQRRFLRHVVRHWDVHRHRIAPQVHATLQQLRNCGQVRLHRGRLDSVAMDGGRIRLDMRMRDRRVQQLDADRVVNATGVEMRAQLMRNPVLSDLLGAGRARPGPHGVGVDTAADGALLDFDGVAQPRLHVMGSLRIGSLWESIAVPELRTQAQAATCALLALPKG